MAQLDMIGVFIATLTVFVLAMLGVAVGRLAGRPEPRGCTGARDADDATGGPGCACAGSRTGADAGKP